MTQVVRRLTREEAYDICAYRVYDEHTYYPKTWPMMTNEELTNLLNESLSDATYEVVGQ